MQQILARENDPQYLKSLIAHKQIIIQQTQRLKSEAEKALSKTKFKFEDLQNKFQQLQSKSQKQQMNLTMAISQLRKECETLKSLNSEIEFNSNIMKMKTQQIQKQHQREMQRLKDQFQSQKELLNIKISKLQSNLAAINNFYHTDEKLKIDRKAVVEDSNRDLRGFSNEKQSRLIILQNQQLSNQVQFQSKNLTNLLQKNQQLLEEIKFYKRELDLHKGIQNQLVKRSSLAQNLIKQLNQRIRQLQSLQEKQELVSKRQQTSRNQQQIISESSRLSSLKNFAQDKAKKQQIDKLKLQIAKKDNYLRYLENKNETSNHKYNTLAELLTNYLEHLLYEKQKNGQETLQGTTHQVTLEIAELKRKNIKQWKFQEIQAVLSLLLIQIKPYLSKNSLTVFPQLRNINISFVEEPVQKEGLSLPKIADEYQKNYDKEVKKAARFKDIPLDISTKILRSNLRQWGKKITYGNPAGNKQFKSRSSIQDVNKSIV